jgi:hypothetical protein
MAIARIGWIKGRPTKAEIWKTAFLRDNSLVFPLSTEQLSYGLVIDQNEIRLYIHLAFDHVTTEEIQRLFDDIRDFGFDPAKRDKNLRERDIDLEDMRFVLDGPYAVRRSDRHGEIRFMVFGFLDDVEVTFVCTFRGDICHVISARRARRDERKKYHHHLPGRSATGKDES